MAIQANDLINIKEASGWATNHLGKIVSTSNISYLIQYGRIKKYEANGAVLVSINELNDYYKSYNGSRESAWRQQLGDDLNWALSFDQYKESETTKHVHRLHPYKGKFIPQLVEYFLDNHTDKFKQEVFFNKGDIVLDPFAGSGTTLVQANELGMHAIGIDVSSFNVMICGCKVSQYNLTLVQHEVDRISNILKKYLENSRIVEFENRLLGELNTFNNQYFPVPEYKYKVRNKQIDEKIYGLEKETEFLPIYHDLVEEYGVKLIQDNPKTFMDKWFIEHIRSEIDIVYQEIQKIEDKGTKKILAIMLSRTIRSCRATTHADLATLNNPVTTTYYCAKHGKICKPLFSMLKWWLSYTKDTIKRLKQFEHLRTDTKQLCITGDSREIDIIGKIKALDPLFGDLLQEQKISGIFTSPPYVGLIDYHEQHAYAYDVFRFERHDDLEIGSMKRGQGKEAQASYVDGISEVLLNCKRLLKPDYNVFMVANDKYNLYPKIAAKAGMKIVNQYKRPVLNRTEKDKSAYSEIIFHLKEI